MATKTLTATALYTKLLGNTYWNSDANPGKASQGWYNNGWGTKSAIGLICLDGSLSGISTSQITQIKMTVKYTGGASAKKTIKFYTGSGASGTSVPTAAQLTAGSALGSYSTSVNAYGSNSETITLSSSSNSSLFSALVNRLTAGYTYFCTYNGESSASSYTNYSNNYVNITALSMTVTYTTTTNKTYKIQFDGNGHTGGSLPPSWSVEGTSYNVTMGDIPNGNVPTKTGYIFRGWSSTSSYNSKRIVYLSSNGGGQDANGDSAEQTSDTWTFYNYLDYTNKTDKTVTTLTLYAQWEKENTTYSVTYSANGVSGYTNLPSSETGLTSTSYTISTTVPYKYNQEMYGYGVGSTGWTGQYPGSDITLSKASTTINCCWDDPTTIYLDTPITSPYYFKYQRRVYEFTTGSVSKKYLITVTSDEDIDLYVYKNSNTAVASKRTSGDESLTVELAASTTYYLHAETYADVHYDNDSTSTTGTITIEEVIDSYTITYNANGGSGAPSTQSGSTSYTISSTIPTKFGYTFIGWSKSSTATSGTSTYNPGNNITLTSNLNLYAVWKQYELNLYGSHTFSKSWADQVGYYAYTPSETRKYVIESTLSSGDSRVYLYKSTSESAIANNDDGGNSQNFRLEQELTAGTTYYYKVNFYSSSTTGAIPFNFNPMYKISYDTNGGNSTISDQWVEHGQEIALASGPSKDNEWDSYSTAVTVSFNSNGGNETFDSDSGYAYTSGEFSFEFANWLDTDTDMSYAAGTYITGTTDRNFQAQWYKYEESVSATGFLAYMPGSTPTKNSVSGGSYTISFNKNGGSSTPTSQKANITINYTFAGWKDSLGRLWYENNGARFYASDTLVAQWDDESQVNSITLPTITRTGYILTGWAPSGGSSVGAPGDQYTPSGTVTLYAQWTPITYGVYYNGNGATAGEMEGVTHTYNVAQALDPLNFVREYTVTFNSNNGTGETNSYTIAYDFKYWTRNQNGTGTQYVDQQSVTNLANTKDAVVWLYAQWEPNTIMLISPSSRIGYTFDGWYTSSSGGTKVGGPGAVYTPNANITLYAHWSKKQITIEYYDNADTALTKTQTFTYGDSNKVFGKTSSGTLLASPTSNIEYATKYGFCDWYILGYKHIGWHASSTSKTPTYETYQAIDDNWIDAQNSLSLTPSNTPVIRLYSVWDYNGTVRIHNKVDNVWQMALPYIFTNGTWKLTLPYTHHDDDWKLNGG